MSIGGSRRGTDPGWSVQEEVPEGFLEVACLEDGGADSQMKKASWGGKSWKIFSRQRESRMCKGLQRYLGE